MSGRQTDEYGGGYNILKKDIITLGGRRVLGVVVGETAGEIATVLVHSHVMSL